MGLCSRPFILPFLQICLIKLQIIAPFRLFASLFYSAALTSIPVID